MRNKGIYIVIITVLVQLLPFHGNVYGQRINFATWSGSSNITISNVFGNDAINFGNLIIGGVSKSVDINGATVYAITAPDGYDLNVTIAAPSMLSGPGTSNNTIPLNISFAYSNLGFTDVATARINATVVPASFTSVSFPVRKSTNGIPAPPPAPLDGQSTERSIKSTAYLFVYGTAGPAVNGTNAGNYLATVTITAEYITN